MASSFDVSVESPVSVEQVFAALADESYWRARLAVFRSGAATLDSLIVDPDGAVSVAVTVGLSRDRLPKLVTGLRRLAPEMVRNEKWSRIDDGRVQGEISVAFSGAPVSAVGEAFLEPVRNGSRLNYTTIVEVKAPLVGGKIESYIGDQLADGIGEIQRFTTDWIAEQG
jgi:Protein of unknown function (DUF2505)